MMYFVQHLQTYVPKNRAWRELVEFVKKYEYILIKNEVSVDALKEEVRIEIERLNMNSPKLKPIRYSFGHIGDGMIRLDASVDKMGCPDQIFFLDICKVRSVYQFGENLPTSNLVDSK